MSTQSIGRTQTVDSTQFPGIPAFPDDVPTAPLLKLSYAKLLAKDPEEVQRCAKACEDLGFFYLNLSEVAEGRNLLQDADGLFGVGEDLFALPVEEKMKYDFLSKNSYFGYKGIGANIVDKKGTLDRLEFYNVSKDDMFDIGEHWPAPDVLSSQKTLMKSYIASAHSIVTLVLEILNDHLNLPPNTLQNMHRLEGHAGDQIRFIRAPPQPADDRQVALGEHTDFGSVTVLFNRVGGLQILPPGRNAQWCYVKPLPGHAIINLGDAMVKFTNGLLRSNIHRVNTPPGIQASSTRYSLVYFNRPEDEVILKRLEGSDKIPPLDKDEVEDQVNSRDWVRRRALGHRIETHGKDAFNWDKVKGTEEKSQRAYL